MIIVIELAICFSVIIIISFIRETLYILCAIHASNPFQALVRWRIRLKDTEIVMSKLEMRLYKVMEDANSMRLTVIMFAML